MRAAPIAPAAKAEPLTFANIRTVADAMRWRDENPDVQLRVPPSKTGPVLQSKVHSGGVA